MILPYDKASLCFLGKENYILSFYDYLLTKKR